MAGILTRIQSGLSDALLAVLVIAILGLMIVPLPPPFLDLMFSFNMIFSIIVLLVSMYVTRPLELSIFPQLLLIMTVLRLSLNVASTRLILGTSPPYAGNVIQSFGTFVVQDNYVVGFIIFIIIIIIQFVVITRGATRIAEVAARFTLDAMPGKQMAIDADLNAGLIDENEARNRRQEITSEADFYGAMDGASKFVRGDVIAGLIITTINIIGGFIIGSLMFGMSWMESIQTYSMLTIGDGLVSQIPALLMSTSAGVIVTRSTSESNFGRDLTHQLGRNPGAIVMSSISLAIFGFIPGLPTAPFLILAMATAGYAAWLLRSKSVEQRREREREIAEAEAPREERVEDYLAVDTLSVEIGYGLIPLVDESQGGDFLDRVTTLRRQIAQELGVIVPPVRIRDNIRLEGNDYIIMIKGNEVARGQVEANMYLAMNPGGDQSEVEGKTTVEPAFGLPAKWISSKEREKAELNGWTVVEPSSVLATHLSEIIKKHAYEIITRQDVQQLVDSVRQDYPVLVDDLIPGQLGLGTLQRVLQHLLKEQIPIRDLVTILETIGDYAANTKDPNTLGEFARVALYRTITRMYIDDENKMTVFTLSPQLERMIMENMQNTSQGVIVNLSPAVSEKMLTNVGAIFEQMLANDQQPIALTSASIRFAFRTMTEISFPRLAVLSYNEVAPEIEIFSVGMVKVE